jgi:hypothetical protein
MYVAREQLGKNVTVAANTHATTEKFLCNPCHINGKKAISSSQNVLCFSFRLLQVTLVSGELAMGKTQYTIVF